MQLSSWDLGSGLFLRPSAVQCRSRGNPNVRSSVAFAVIIRIPVLSVELCNVVRVDLDRRDAATTQGLAADPQSGHYPAALDRYSETEPQNSHGKGFTRTATRRGRERTYDSNGAVFLTDEK